MNPRVPRYLHLPLQILWFDLEDIAIVIVCYVLALMTRSIYAYVLVIIGPYAFMNTKSRRPRGWMRHMLCQFGFARLRGYPPPMAGRFEE